jgi:aminoglycoside phosphotransferase (APT) family kinase protein
MSEQLPGLETVAVAEWMLANVPGCEAPVEFSLIAGGHSNLTYGANQFVVRRGPLGTARGGAHDMGREYRVIAALGDTPVPVPRALALCDDESVTAGSFYMMSRVEGAVLANVPAADAYLPDRAARRLAGQQVVDVLADLAGIDVDAAGLGGAARRDDFLGRQIRRFSDMWERTRTRGLPAMSDLASRLSELAPPQRHTGIVHGDYRIGNVMHDAGGQLVAVLDWELWTLGDVLADLGFLINNWYEPDDPNPLVFMEMPPTATGDFGSRNGVIERYAQRTGFDVSAIDYYRGFQYWRMAVLAEGVKRRYESSQMASRDVDFGHLDERVIDLAALAEQHLDLYRP